MTDYSVTVLDQALHYAKEFGWLVLPLYSIENGACTCGKTDCTSPGKHPATRNGLKDATTDESRIRAWFENHNYNVGIATGPESDLLVVDVDVDKGADLIDLTMPEGAMAPLDNVLDTVTVKTGAGWHYYYKYPAGENLKNTTSRLGKFIDTRAAGGYVVAPPSIHTSGNIYEFDPSFETLRELPADWLRILKAPAQSAAPAQAQATNGSGLHIPPPKTNPNPDTIVSGSRNNTLASLAGKMRHYGFGQKAIEDALLAENERVCQPPLDEKEVRDIARKISNNYQPAAPFHSIATATPNVSAKTIDNWDDVSITRLFCDEFESTLRFCPQAKKWLIWNGKRWEFDDKNIVKAKATEFSQGLYGRVLQLIKTQADMKTAHRQIQRSNSNTGLGAFLELSKSFLALSTDELDRNPYLLNCKNGTIDLRTGDFRAHAASDYITKLVPYDFDASAKTNAFDDFLNRIQPDPSIRKFIQQSIGYSLLGIARERTFWILYGNGNNGKSVFIDLFSEILNDYASATASGSVMANKADRIPNDIARLRGQRFIVIPETEENERLNASLIKALSAGDKITARFLFGEFFDFYFSGKLWIATNHKPTITDHSKGFWDRLKIIPFAVDIPKTQVIKRDTLLNSLLAEAPAILAWAVRGVTEYFQADRLEVPKVIQDEIDTYKYEQDSIAQFIDECCVIGAYETVSNPKLYRRYVEFCTDNGEYPRKQRRLTQSLKERGFTQNPGRNPCREWVGIGLKF